MARSRRRSTPTPYRASRTSKSGLLNLVVMVFILGVLLSARCSSSDGSQQGWVNVLLPPSDLSLPKSVLDLELEKNAQSKRESEGNQSED